MYQRTNDRNWILNLRNASSWDIATIIRAIACIILKKQRVIHSRDVTFNEPDVSELLCNKSYVRIELLNDDDDWLDGVNNGDEGSSVSSTITNEEVKEPVV